MAFEAGIRFEDYINRTGLSYGHAHKLVHSYGLRFEGRYKRISEKARERRYQLSLRWNPNLTIGMNAKNLGISSQLAGSMVREFVLNYRHCQHLKPAMIKRIYRIKAMLDKEITHAEIARYMGYSRERIRQLIIRGKEEGII